LIDSHHHNPKLITRETIFSKHFKKDQKTVHFDKKCYILYIPSREDIGLLKVDLWYTKQDIIQFRSNIIFEIEMHAMERCISFEEADKELRALDDDDDDFDVINSIGVKVRRDTMSRNSSTPSVEEL
jgi:hypothetical protein